MQRNPEPEAPSGDARSARSPSRMSMSKRQKAILAVGVVLMVIGLSFNVYFQAKMDEELTLSDDFDNDFTSEGLTTNFNRDYLIPYNPMYNGIVTSRAS